MIKYTLVFNDETRLTYDVSPEVAEFPDPEGDIPVWTELENNKCECCTIPQGERRACPAALTILPVVEALDLRFSHEEVGLKVEQNGVQISTKVSTQDGLRSLLGLKLPFSNCPVVSRLRPMAYLHVPLGGTLHTNFRFIGMHLVAQYLRALDGKKPDWELKGLQQLIKELNQVNRGLAARIRTVATEDAAVNSVVLLDALASEVLWNIELSLEDLRPLFEAYIESD